MGKDKIIHLNVKTVPAFDIETKAPHTAYTVYCMREGAQAIASAWTLKDAIMLFRMLYDIKEQVSIRLIRPFKPQYSKLFGRHQ